MNSMIRTLTFSFLLTLLAIDPAFSQCAVNFSNNSIYGFNDPSGSGGFSGFLCGGTDSVGTLGVNGYYDGDGYTIKLVAGSRVTFSVDSCTGDPVSLTITDSVNQVIPGAYSSPACPNSLNFTAPYTGEFVVVINRNGICGGGGSTLIGEAYVKIQQGTPVPDCPDANVINDTICGAIALGLDAPFVQGNTSLAYPTDPIDGYITSIGCTCSVPNNTLWYSYTATISSDSAFIFLTSDAGSNFHSWLNVFVANDTANTCQGGLFFLGCQEGPNDTVGIDTVIVTIYGLIAGNTYYFMIDGFNGSTGGFSISIRSSELITGNRNINTADILNVFPSPAGNFVVVASGKTIYPARLILENTLGQVVFEKHYPQYVSETINTTHLPAGIYRAILTNAEGTAVKKFVVSH
jgi:hypothetical protein